MAEQIAQDVVNEAQSMGDPSPIDVNATPTNVPTAGDGKTTNDSTTATANPSVPTDDTSSTFANLDAKVSASSAQRDTAGAAASATEGAPQFPSASGGSSANTSSEKLVNGDSVEHLSPEDALNQSAIADASGGSDTDSSRADGSDTRKPGSAIHIRSNSVKKPTAFKAVKVTKNFLAKAAVAAPSSKVGDKASSTGQANSLTQQTAKPRLVAKSGSGFGNSIPRSGLSRLNGAGSGPDASKVWNKNQPIPPPPPKQFTDEELKQQYGIHMATRLSSTEEGGKEAKWADIDDDEDDWAPEAVEWVDGTKSTVTAAENQPPPAEEVKPATSVKSEASETRKPAQIAGPRPSSTGGTKTILKPGAHAAASQTKTGLVLRGAVEKPSLVTKPLGTAPAKSPWAPLPPIEKVSPIQINPPAQPPPPSRFGQRDPHGFESLGPALSHTKEIAADDFNRSWREERTNKELFNSQSGRYEPVSEMRRGSIRNDPSLRQPSVLQRPSQYGPAEPSAAFQTSRSSAGEGGPWARRRGSSNVSGGSGQVRRMSFGRPQDLPPIAMDMQERRESQSRADSDVMTPTDSPRPRYHQPMQPFADRGASPARQGPWPRASPVMNHAQPASPHGSAASLASPDGAPMPQMPPVEDPVALQQRLMREKIERARAEKQRREEEERKEEAARKERLRLKMEALGPAPEVKHEKPKESTTSSIGSDKQPSPQEKISPLPSPPKPPVPTSEEEVAQYGMMKLHRPHPVKKPAGTSPLEMTPDIRLSQKSVESPRDGAPVQRPSPSPARSPAKTPQSAAQHVPPSPKAIPQMEAGPVQEPIPSRQQLPEQKTPAWRPGIASESYGGWANNTRGSASSVWGPPNRDRALGNGTFDGSFNRLGNDRLHNNEGRIIGPGPIAPPNSQKEAASLPLSSNNLRTDHHTAPYSETQSRPPTLPPQQPSTSSSTQNSLANSSSDMAASVARPGSLPSPLQGSFPNNMWGGGHMNAIQALDAQIAQQNRDRRDELDRNGGISGPRFKETFRQTASSGIGSRRVVKEETHIHDFRNKQSPDVRPVTSEASSSKTDQLHPIARPESGLQVKSESQFLVANDKQPSPIGSEKAQQQAGVTATSQTGAHTTQGGRPSRFFPRTQASPSQPAATSSKSESPPPPDSSSALVEGDAAHPTVKLPYIKPTPKVKLPQPPDSQPKSPVVPAHVPHLPPIGARPIVAQVAWQDRINNLLGAQTHGKVQQSPHPHAQALAVTSASKAPLDVSTTLSSATVSLPTNGQDNKVVRKSPFKIDTRACVTSKASAEDDFMSQREFGSLPLVLLPKKKHINADLPPSFPPKTYQHSRASRQVEITTKDALMFPLSEHGSDNDSFHIHIRVPSMAAMKVVYMPRRTKKGGRGYKGKRNFSPRENSNSNSGPGNGNNKGPRPRNLSSSQQAQGSQSQNNSSRPSTSGNPWNNNRSGSSNNPWNKRPSGVVH